MGNGKSKQDDRGADGFSSNAAGHYNPNEAAEILCGGYSSSRLELSFSCKDLIKGDTFSKSDPMVVAYQREGNGSLSEFARTEVISNNHDPKFVTRGFITYNFEENVTIVLEVYDVDSKHVKGGDSKSLRLPNENLLGGCQCQLADLARSRNITRKLMSAKGQETKQSIIVHCEELANTNVHVKLGLRCVSLKNKEGLMSKSDPFLKLSKLREDGSWSPCYKSEVRMNQLSPTFDVVKGPILQLTNGDMHRPIRIEVWDWNRNGTHTFMGMCETTLDELNAKPSDGLTLIDPKNPKSHRQKLVCYMCELERRPTFLDYVRGGTELNFIVAVDFTLSNGHPASPKSLHYVHPSGQVLNAYANAIIGVGSVLDFYDTNKSFPCYGFGGKAHGGVANHCFSLTGDDSNPLVHGIDGILAAYYQSLTRVELSGPTIFEKVVRQAIAYAHSAEQSQHKSTYFCLLILTDGVVNDTEKTIEALIDASGLPLSVIIAGVGNEDFSDMTRLDGDEHGLLKSRKGNIAKRDIVNFTALNSIKEGGSMSYQAKVAKAILEEFPRQVVEYYQGLGIQPNVPETQRQSSVPVENNQPPPPYSGPPQTAPAASPPPPAYSAAPPAYAAAPPAYAAAPPAYSASAPPAYQP
jgi:hypothetical protein